MCAMSPTNCWNLRVTAEVNQGGRRYMEDVTAVQFERAKGDKKVVEYAAFAVFDGHGGKEAAHFARDHMLDNIKNQKGFFSKDVEAVKKAICAGFIATHQQMWNELSNWPKTYNGHPSTAGTTASLVLIRGNKMYVANVGDSMVVMGTRDNQYKNNPRAFQAMELTVDHKPELFEERKRIELCGGCVMNKAGVNRVVWNRPKLSHNGPIRRSTKLDKIPFLAIARSLGDLWSFNSELNEFIVSPVPDVHVYDLLDEREQFVILASDGLWNMVRPYESVTSAGTFDERKQKKLVSGTPAHELVQLALDRWKMRAMRADNTSVIVVYIERKKMESMMKRRDTYSESWTSARVDGSKFQVDNTPYRGEDKPTNATSSESIPIETNCNKEVISTECSKDHCEPVQDCSISSSSGEVLEKNTLPKINSIANWSNPQQEYTSADYSDEPTSSVFESDLIEHRPTKGTELGRPITRNGSRALENSVRRMTRSYKRKISSSNCVDKKRRKRKIPVAEDLNFVKSRKLIFLHEKRTCKAEAKRLDAALNKSSVAVSKTKEIPIIRQRSRSLENLAKIEPFLRTAPTLKSKSGICLSTRGKATRSRKKAI